MSNKYTNNLEEIATYGFDEIDQNEKVEVNLKDLMYVFSMLQEYQRFFHQPMHYKTLEDVERFLGGVKDHAGFKLLHTSIYDKMSPMLPTHISKKYRDGDFDSPKFPSYYDENK